MAGSKRTLGANAHGWKGTVSTASWHLVAYALAAVVVGASAAGLYVFVFSNSSTGTGSQYTTAAQSSLLTTTVTSSVGTAQCYTVTAYQGVDYPLSGGVSSGYSGEIYAPDSRQIYSGSGVLEELCVPPGEPVSLMEGSKGGEAGHDFIGWLGTGAGSYTGLGSIMPPYNAYVGLLIDGQFFTFQNYTFTMPPDNITETAYFGAPNQYMCLPSGSYAPGNALAACKTIGQMYFATCEGDSASGCPQDIGSSPTVDCGTSFSGVLCFNYGAIPSQDFPPGAYQTAGYDPTYSIELPPFVSSTANDGCFPNGIDGAYEGISDGC